MNIYKMYYELENKTKITNDKIQVGILKFLENRDIPIHTKEIYLTSKGLSHLSRDSKKSRGAGLELDDILRIPNILETPFKIIFDNRKAKLNLLYFDKKDIYHNRLIKVVIDTKGFYKKLGAITLIKTAGYIELANLNDKYYIQII